MKIVPSPTLEEAAAFVAALETLLEEEQQEVFPSLKRRRWRLAGLLGHDLEPGMKLEGSLWSYSRWEGMV